MSRSGSLRVARLVHHAARCWLLWRRCATSPPASSHDEESVTPDGGLAFGQQRKLELELMLLCDCARLRGQCCGSVAVLEVEVRTAPRERDDGAAEVRTLRVQRDAREYVHLHRDVARHNTAAALAVVAQAHRRLRRDLSRFES